MDVTFHWIKYQNILSVGAKPITITLDNYKKTLFTGSNGAGKSTFIEALTFMLYGKAFRDIPKPIIINSQNKKGLLVEGELSVGKDKFHIQRGMKPNILKITKNGEALKEVASVTEYQAYFEEELLGISYDSFKQIIVLGTAGYKPFMELPAGKRRELVEDLLDVSVIGDMDKLNKGIIKELKGNQDLLRVKLNSAESEQQTAESAIVSQQRQTENMIAMLANTFRDIAGQAKSFKEGISKTQSELDSLVEPVYVEQDDSDEIAENRKNLIDAMKNSEYDFEQQLKELESNLACHRFDMPHDCALDHDVMMLENSKPTDEQLRAKTAEITIPAEPIYKNPVEPDVVDIREELNLATRLRTAFELDKRQLLGRREFFENGGTCPTCGTDCSSHAHDRISSIDEEINAIDLKIKEQDVIIQDLTDQERNYELALRDYKIRLNDDEVTKRDYERETANYAQTCRRLSEEHAAEIARIDREIESMNLNHVRQKMEYDRKLRLIEDEIRSCKDTAKDVKLEYEERLSVMDTQSERLRNDRISKHEIAVANYKSTIESLTTKIVNDTASYEAAADNARNLKKQIDDLKETVYDMSQVEAAKQRANELKDEIAKIVLELHHRSIVADMLKDNGVKAHIVKRYIPVFNKKINEYLKALGADYVFALDEGFNESIKSRGREDFCYASFSEGEKARINLSLLFTWRDVSSMISGVNINLLCMDEVFDGSCDDMGVVGINKMLDDMKSNIIVISHRKDAMDDSFNRHIRMHKQGRFTTMVENVR